MSASPKDIDWELRALAAEELLGEERAENVRLMEYIAELEARLGDTEDEKPLEPEQPSKPLSIVVWAKQWEGADLDELMRKAAWEAQAQADRAAYERGLPPPSTTGAGIAARAREYEYQNREFLERYLRRSDFRDVDLSVLESPSGREYRLTVSRTSGGARCYRFTPREIDVLVGGSESDRTNLAIDILESMFRGDERVTTDTARRLLAATLEAFTKARGEMRSTYNPRRLPPFVPYDNPAKNMRRKLKRESKGDKR